MALRVFALDPATNGLLAKCCVAGNWILLPAWDSVNNALFQYLVNPDPLGRL